MHDTIGMTIDSGDTEIGNWKEKKKQMENK